MVLKLALVCILAFQMSLCLSFKLSNEIDFEELKNNPDIKNILNNIVSRIDESDRKNTTKFMPVSPTQDDTPNETESLIDSLMKLPLWNKFPLGIKSVSIIEFADDEAKKNETENKEKNHRNKRFALNQMNPLGNNGQRSPVQQAPQFSTFLQYQPKFQPSYSSRYSAFYSGQQQQQPQLPPQQPQFAPQQPQFAPQQPQFAPQQPQYVPPQQPQYVPPQQPQYVPPQQPQYVPPQQPQYVPPQQPQYVPPQQQFAPEQTQYVPPQQQFAPQEQQQQYEQPQYAPQQQQQYEQPQYAPQQQQPQVAPAPAPAPVLPSLPLAPSLPVPFLPVSIMLSGKQQSSQTQRSVASDMHQQPMLSAPAQQAYAPVSQRDPAYDLPNTCSVGLVQPIWEEDQITETYCRCPDGGYGYNCQEGFKNPCNGYAQYYPADHRVPNNYFIECSWNTPYLMKCAKGTVWNQQLLTCDWTADASHETYGAYSNNQPAQSYSHSVASPAPVSQHYGGY